MSAGTKSRADIAQTCRELSERLLDLSTDFDHHIAWTDHARYLHSMAVLLMIYSSQVEGKKE